MSETAEAIIAAAPDFRERWDHFRQSDEYGEGEPHNHLAQLAHFLVDAIKAGSVEGFPSVFREVEDRLVSATPEERDLIIVGLLEDLQNISLNRDVALVAWAPWLGRTTAEAWKVLDDMWSGRITPADFNSYVQGPDARPRSS